MQGFRSRMNLMAAAVALASASIVAAQMAGGMSPADVQQKVMQSMQANAQAMKNYTWKSRIEVQKDGDTRKTELFQVRYDYSGNLQRTALNASTPEESKRGLRGRIVEKKKEEFKELVQDLATLAKSYANLSPDKMQNFKQHATVGRKLDGTSKDILVQSKDVVQPGDSMTITIDPTTQKQTKVEIQSALDGNPVTVNSDFKTLSDGLNYMARSVITYAKQGLQLTTENFDYQRSSQ